MHTVAMHEYQGFQPRESLREGEPDRDDVLLKEVDGRLRVELVVTPFGAPGRSRRPPAVWLERGAERSHQHLLRHRRRRP